jgi:hypothetical protein
VPLEELLPSAVGARAGSPVVRVWLMLRLQRDELRGPGGLINWQTIGDTMTGDNVTHETNEKHRIRQ